MLANKRKAAPALAPAVLKSQTTANGSMSSRFGFKPQTAAAPTSIKDKENSVALSNSSAAAAVSEKSVGEPVAEPATLMTAPTPKKSRIVAQPPLAPSQLAEERDRVTAEIQSEILKRDGISSIFSQIYSEEVEAEAKKAAQAKVTAAKLNFKDQISQLSANVKILKKALGTELTGRAEFLKRANSIELFYQLEIRDRSLRSWDLQQAINALHAKFTAEERKSAAVESERQKLIAQLRENSSEQEKLDLIVSQYKREKDELMAQYENLSDQTMEFQSQIE